MRQTAVQTNAEGGWAPRLLPSGCEVRPDRSIGGWNGRLEISRHLASFFERMCLAARSHVVDASKRLDRKQSWPVCARIFRVSGLDRPAFEPGMIESSDPPS